ncbi:trichohyalin-plectin-like domain-containing protein [Phthorimaea operculella]|nr:trichohyalin-plectin-like domain-containing protein [Phthorimaea operculella]
MRRKAERYGEFRYVMRRVALICGEIMRRVALRRGKIMSDAVGNSALRWAPGGAPGSLHQGLRTLTRKLEAAYVCRDLQQQIRNNQYRRLQEKAEENKIAEKLTDSIYSDKEYREVEMRNKAERARNYCQELQQQLVSRQRQKQCQYEDTLIEKKMLDEIMRTITDEDRREIEQKREQMEKTRREMDTFKQAQQAGASGQAGQRQAKQAQQAWRAKQKQIVLAEEKEIEKQQAVQADRQASVNAKREQIIKQREESNQRVAEEILATEWARQEREDIIRSLQEQEHLEANFQQDISEQMKRERIKRENKEGLMEQMAIKKQQQAQEREIAANYLKQLKQRMAEEEAKEAEKQRLIKEKNKQHCALLLKQAEEQRLKKIEAEKGDAARANATREYEQKWREEVAKERESIVREHAPKLLGYLQAGVIKKEDLPTVREGANKDPELAKLNIEGLTLAKRPKRFAKCNAQCLVLREY